MTQQEMIAELERLRAENNSLRSERGAGLRLKVAENSGGISLYGLGRFPVTLHDTQWEQVIELVESGTLRKFLDANASKIRRKDETKEAYAARMGR